MSEDDQSVYEWVLQDARENPRAPQSGPWTSKDHLKQAGVKAKHGGYSREEISDAVSRGLVQNDLIGWHGLLAPTDEDSLRAIIEAEQEADITRKILVGKVNRYIRELHREDTDSASNTDATSQEVEA